MRLFWNKKDIYVNNKNNKCSSCVCCFCGEEVFNKYSLFRKIVLLNVPLDFNDYKTFWYCKNCKKEGEKVFTKEIYLVESKDNMMKFSCFFDFELKLLYGKTGVKSFLFAKKD